MNLMTFQEWVILEKNGESHSYSCVMARFNKRDAQSVLDWSDKNIKDSVLYTEQSGFGRENEIHVTILYGLHTKNYLDVKELMKDSPPFELELGVISKFDNEKYDVIKFEVKSPVLHNLNKKLKTLDFTSKFDEYVPHCTVAYVKKGSCDHLLGNKALQGKVVRVDSIVFSPAENTFEKNKKVIPLASL